MSERQLTDGSPVPADGSHANLRPDGQQEGYVVLSPEERAQGFVKPLRASYIHTGAHPKMAGRILIQPDRDACGTITRMGISIAETYAREPSFYSGTFCASCKKHFKLTEFRWLDGEPMHVPDQDAWAKAQIHELNEWRKERISALRAEITQLESELTA